MPRNAATNSNTEAERLPILIPNKQQSTTNKIITKVITTSKTATTNTANSVQLKKNKKQKRQKRQKRQKETIALVNFPKQATTKNSQKNFVTNKNITSNTSLTSRTFEIYITEFNRRKDSKAWNENIDFQRDSDTGRVYKSPLYPAVIDIKGNSPPSGEETTNEQSSLSKSASTSSTTIPTNIGISCTLCTKLPSFIKRKRKSRFKSNNSTRDHTRLATLRVRKNPILISGLNTGNKRKKSTQVKEQPVAKTLPPQLNASELNKIEVLEFDETKTGAGSSGGTKRKRNNSLTTASLTVTTRKRAATVKTNPLHTVEPKGFISGGSGGNTVSNMSLYERRYQTTTSTADDTGGRVATSNGYLSSTRSSSASSGVLHTSNDNGLTDVPMETQYYLTAGGTSTASSNIGTGVSLSNGSSSATTSVSTINHAPSMATLCNIGNSCYLNSVVYTLRFAPRFLHNLHHLIVDLATVQQNIVRHRAKSASLGRGINAAQLENSARSWSSKDLASLEQYNSNASTQSGNGGLTCGGDICKSRHQLLTEKLHELFQSLHRNEVAESTEPHHADKLLHAIQDVNAIFEGNQQQDAHEFLMCVLNSIRETCQTLIKMIADCPELILEGNIQCDETDANERELTGTGNSNSPLNQQITTSASSLSAQGSSSLSTSNITKSSFFSRKSKRKEEAKSAKNFRLQSPLKDGTNVPQQQQQQQQQQTIANSHFYLNSVDLSGANTASSPTSATPPNSLSLLTNSASSDTSDLSTSNPVAKQRLAEKIRQLGLDFFSEDFEGITVATTKCLSCETVTEQKESMIDIAVPVPISGYDSSEYMEKPSAFIQKSCITREYFRAENKYRCEQCTGYTEAIRSISYEVLPRLLVIQLSRFSGGMEKINSYIPTSFTLQCFCSKCCELSDANKLHVYKLYSVITHVGATMSVGHYIAYTCSLDWANEYVNCPKDRRAVVNQMQQQPNGLISQTRDGNSAQTTTAATSSTTQTSAASAAASALASSGTSLIKKMKFGRSKASSSGDISKNFKNLNGMTNAATAAAAAAAASANSQSITNGISKLSMNTTCHSLNCCATRLSTVQHQQHQQQQQQQQYNLNDLSEESIQNGANHNAVAAAVTSSSSSGGSYASYSSGYGSTGRGGTKATPFAASSNGAEPIWYMCDDDKIKAMTQREFEELLSPSRKITITPYLLFYARFDLQQSTTASTTTATGTAAQQTSSNQTTPQSQSAMSWSSENLQSGSVSGGLHKI